MFQFSVEISKTSINSRKERFFIELRNKIEMNNSIRS